MFIPKQLIPLLFMMIIWGMPTNQSYKLPVHGYDDNGDDDDDDGDDVDVDVDVDVDYDDDDVDDNDDDVDDDYDDDVDAYKKM